jgi:hypothetical protein
MIDDDDPTRGQNNAEDSASTSGPNAVEVNKPSTNPEPDNKNPRYQLRIRERLTKWHEQREAKWKDTPVHDRSNVRLTRVIAASTVLYTLFAGWTLREIHSGGTDTHNLAVAAGKQESHTEEIAQAAQDQVDAANEISDAADSFSDTADTAVEEFKKAAAQSAKDSEKAVHNAERTIKQAQDSFRDEQRAWVGLSNSVAGDFSEIKGFEVSVIFLNSGRTPARNVQFSVRYKLSPMAITGPPPEEIELLTFRHAQSIAPQGTYSVKIAAQQVVGEPTGIDQAMGNAFIKANFKSIKDKTNILYYFGILKYDDAFGNHRQTQYCLFIADPDTKQLGICDSFNDLE